MAKPVDVHPVALRPDEYMDMPTAEVEARRVDCHNCPVNLLCKSGTGGSGIVCKKCRYTGVLIDADSVRPEHAYYIDCFKHGFEEDPEEMSDPDDSCDMCDGYGLMLHEQMGVYPYVWIIPTVHSWRSVADRQQAMRDGLVRAKAELASPDAAPVAESAKRKPL